jgi:hypothetical protein
MSAETAPDAAPPPAASEQPNVIVAESATEVAPSESLAPALSDGAREEQTAAPDLALSGRDEAALVAERKKEAERIRTSALLPPAMRDCLARVVEHSGVAAPGSPTRVPVDELVRAVEEAVPEFLRVDRLRARVPEHPAGDAFFHEGESDLSDRQAEEIAKAQLARSGLLRGQRVRVAD